MNGARMRSNSLFGTWSENIKLSVPRLSAPCSARTQTEPVGGAKSTSSRSSARPGAMYQSACAMSFRSLDTSVSRLAEARRLPGASAAVHQRWRATDGRRAAGAHIGLSNDEAPVHLPPTPKLVNDRAVAVLAASSRRQPGRWQAQQKRAADHERQNNRPMASFGDRVLRLSDDPIDAVFGVRLG